MNAKAVRKVCVCVSDMSELLKQLFKDDEFREVLQKCVSKIVTNAIVEVKDDQSKRLAEAESKLEKQDSVIFDLENGLDEKEAEISTLRGTLSTMNQSLQSLQREVNDLQKYSRRNSIRVYGIPEKTGEDTDAEVIEVVKNLLKCPLTTDDIDRSHRTGKPHPTGSEAKPRPILVKFCSYRKKAEVLKVKRKLENTGISIHEDLTSRNYDLLKKASKNPKVEAAWSLIAEFQPV